MLTGTNEMNGLKHILVLEFLKSDEILKIRCLFTTAIDGQTTNKTKNTDTIVTSRSAFETARQKRSPHFVRDRMTQRVRFQRNTWRQRVDFFLLKSLTATSKSAVTTSIHSQRGVSSASFY